MSEHKYTCERCQHKLCARRVPVFSALDEEELGRVVNLIIRRRYVKGELIIMEGSHLESLIIVNSGQVKAFRDTVEGKEQILYIFSEGDFFGEKNLLRNQEATYSIEALEETHVCMIEKNDFQKLLRDFPGIGLKIMEELCGRLDRLENAVESMGTKNVEARVNAVLLEFARKYGKNHSEGIMVVLPLSREGIANYIGLT
jgi:CRP/FNR family transcriptional regulator, anaerobic regulatory protein